MVRIARTIIVAAVGCALVLAGYQKIVTDRRDQAVAELEALNERLSGELEERAAMIGRLGRERRVARVKILDQQMHGDGLVAGTQLLFVELDEQGGELARQSFDIPGNVLFVDAWTVKFKRDDVAVGHPLHGRTLVLLRRIYSDRMAPIDGYTIDTPGAVPPGYATSDLSRFEQKIWEHFWSIAVDPELASSMGVRVAQGEAIYKPVLAGQEFDLVVDAAGGMSLTPVPAEPRTASGISPSLR